MSVHREFLPEIVDGKMINPKDSPIIGGLIKTVSQLKVGTLSPMCRAVLRGISL